MPMQRTELIFAVRIGAEHAGDGGMVDRLLAVVRDQILLADIGDIAAFAIFGEQVVEGLVLVRPDLLGNGLVPFFGIGEDRIYIDHPAPKTEEAALNENTQANR